MKERFNKEKLENINDIWYIIFTLEEEIKRCWLLSYKRKKLKKCLNTFSNIIDEVRKTNPELLKNNWI